MIPLGPIVITRQQYDEALARLPDPHTHPGDSFDVDIDGASLMRKVGITGVPGTEHWPMTVTFFKAHLPDGLFDLDDMGSTCWCLAPGYEII